MYTRVKRERPQIKRDMYGLPINYDEKEEKSTSDSETQDQQSDDDSESQSYFNSSHVHWKWLHTGRQYTDQQTDTLTACTSTYVQAAKMVPPEVLTPKPPHTL